MNNQLSELIRERAGLLERWQAQYFDTYDGVDFFICGNCNRSCGQNGCDFCGKNYSDFIGKEIHPHHWLPLIGYEYYFNPNGCIYKETYDGNVFVIQYDFSKDFDSQSEEFHQWLWQQLSNS